jgi:iron complex outermembrane receptor protein
MFTKKPLAYSISWAIAAGSLTMINPVLAQDQDVPQDDAEDLVEEVLVTGSRIRRDGFTSSTPIDVVMPENADIQGIADVGTLLQSTSVAAGSSQVTSATSTAFVENGGLGAQTISLRGLGDNRTLTLLNGRRAGPAGVRGGVSAFDFNVLPLAVIERVEILKDGASSIYGSDAVAGVINIITRTDDGGTAEAYVGVPQDGGGEEYRFSASWGASGERGRFRVTVDYHMNKELAFGDRDYLACGQPYIFDTNSGERRDPIDPRTGRPHCREFGGLWGHVWLYDYQYDYTGQDGNVPPGAKAQYDYFGDLGNYLPPIADPGPQDPYALRTPPGWFLVNYDRESDALTSWDHPFQDTTSFYPETERTTFFGDGTFQLTDSVEMYAEVLLNRRTSKANGYRQYWGYIYNENFFAGNPLSAGWTGAQWLSPTPITDHADSEVELDYQRFVAGVRGDLGESWIWDVSAQYSSSDGEYTNDRIYSDSIRDQNWLSGSCEGTPTSVRGVPCQDIPWLDPQFLAGEVDPAMREFLFGTETGSTEYTQWSIEGFVSGGLFMLPAGEVAGAFGFHYREDEINDVPGEITLAGNTWGSSGAGITAGKDETTAFFGELDVPIIANKTGFEYFGLNASARWTDVESYGDDWTYKIGLNWQITDSFRFRANRGTSFRAPALFELYLADQTSFVGQRLIDPCIGWGDKLDAGDISQTVASNCAATTTDLYPNGLPPDYTGGTITGTVIEGGGLGVLEAETSENDTIGFVWTPSFADLRVSIDYFDILVENQVDQIGPQAIVGGCYSSEFFPTDPLCNLFDRSGVNNGIENIRDSFINVATQSNKGYDFALNWITDLWGGSFDLDAQATKQTEAITAVFEETSRDNNGQFGEPEWVGRLWLTWSRNDWSFFWGMNYVGEVSNLERLGGDPTATYRGEDVGVVVDADSVLYHSLSVTKYFFDGSLRGVLGVRNALDEDPPQVTRLNLGANLRKSGSAAGPYSQYDYYGRTFYMNLRYDF